MITANQDTNPASSVSNPNPSRPPAPKPGAKRKTTTSKGKSAPSTGKPAQKIQSASRPHSKQGRVVAMLQRTEGVTVAAVMKATGWQKHSVHGFFAGVVRKKLGLNLVSAKTDGGKRIYRVVGGKTGTKPGKRVDRTRATARKRAAA